MILMSFLKTLQSFPQYQHDSRMTVEYFEPGSSRIAWARAGRWETEAEVACNRFLPLLHEIRHHDSES